MIEKAHQNLLPQSIASNLQKKSGSYALKPYFLVNPDNGSPL